MRLDIFPHSPWPLGFAIIWNIYSYCESLTIKCRILWQSSHFFGLCVGDLCLSASFCSVQLFAFPIVGLLSSPFDASFLRGTLLFPILFLNLCTWPRVHVNRLSSLATGFLPPICLPYTIWSKLFLSMRR